MAGLMSRASTVVKARLSKLLDRAEDPSVTLDYSYEKQREAEQSVNFVTCHDGFTLNDLVSYNQKHNEANGEDNRDGANDNHGHSSDCNG